MSPVPEAPKQSPSGWRPSPLPPGCCLTAHLRKTTPCLPPRRPPASWPREHWSGVAPALAPLLCGSSSAASAVGNGAHVLGNRVKGRRMLALPPSRRTGRRWTVDFSLPSSDPWLRSSFALQLCSSLFVRVQPTQKKDKVTSISCCYRPLVNDALVLGGNPR